MKTQTLLGFWQSTLCDVRKGTVSTQNQVFFVHFQKCDCQPLIVPNKQRIKLQHHTSYGSLTNSSHFICQATGVSVHFTSLLHISTHLYNGLSLVVFCLKYVGSSQFSIQTQTFYELFISSAALRWDLNAASCSGLSVSRATFNV